MVSPTETIDHSWLDYLQLCGLVSILEKADARMPDMKDGSLSHDISKK
jgi:hypothetical protein